MKKKFFIAIYTTAIVAAVVFLSVVVTTIKRNPGVEPTPEEVADITIAQYAERANSPTTSESVPFFLFSYFFPRSQALDEGCSLTFSYTPKRKAVEPQGNIEYVIRVVNKGRETCRGSSLSLYYRNEEVYVTSDPEPTASDYYWAFGDLTSGQSTNISLTTKTSLRDGQELISEGCVTADNGSDVCSQTVIFIQRGASSIGTMLTEKIRLPTIPNITWGSSFRAKEFGIWVWDSPKVMTPEHAANIVSMSRENGFNVIYVTVDDYLEIAGMRNAEERKQQREEYMVSLSVFVQAAKQAGVAVDAVGGAKDWAIRENRWKGYALIDFVKEYNATYPNAALRGLQYDVEPYLLDEYVSDKKKILKEFVWFVDESARRMSEVNARFSIVIPHFYDSEQKWTPSFSYEGESAHTFTHLLRVLAQKEDSSIIIMSYRNFFEGDNGTRQISEVELREATEGGYATKVIVAQETGNVPPEYVTFHDYPKVSLHDALEEIQSYFDEYDAFGGMAIHYFDSFLKMD